MGRFIIRIFILLIVIACSNEKTEMIKKSEGNRSKVKITIERDFKTNLWKVEYSFVSPVESIIFKRSADLFRKDHFKLIGSNFEFATINQKEVIRRKDQKKFSKVKFTHESRFKRFSKDYELNIRFGGRNTLFYTGHYLLKGDSYEHIFDLINKNQNQIVIDGKTQSDELVTWSNKSQKGHYIYWGTTSPKQSESIMMMMDRNIPKWIVSEVETKMPKIFEYYAKNFRYNLNFRPTLFLNYTNRDELKLERFGNSLPGQLQMSLSGALWKIKDSENMEALFHLMAHEAAHLWNSQEFKNKGEDSWMHEGSAEMFALKALRDFKIISVDRYEELINKSLIGCILNLNDELPVAGSKSQKNHRVSYNCGLVISLLTENTIKDGDIFNFWGELFNSSKNKSYTEENYMERWKILKKRSVKLEKIEDFIFLGKLPPSVNLRAAFIGAGLMIKDNFYLTRSFRKQIARSLVRDLQRQNCNSRNLTMKSGHIHLHGIKDCEGLDSDFELQRIEGLRIFSDVDKIMVKLDSLCGLNKKIRISDRKGKSREIYCHDSILPQSLFKISYSY